MALEIILLALLTLLTGGIGTLTGFGTSTIMVPILLFFFPLPVTLLFAGIIHWFGNIWKMMFFRSGVRWRLLFLFGATGLVASYFGASLIVTISETTLSRLLGVFLLAYVGWLTFNPQWKLPERNATALVVGFLSGFFAGIFGVGGAVRGAFLAAYNLPKEVYLFTIGAIAMIVDSARLGIYWNDGVRLPQTLLLALVASIPTSLAGAYFAKSFINRIPSTQFRKLVAGFLALVAIKLLVWS